MRRAYRPWLPMFAREYHVRQFEVELLSRDELDDMILDFQKRRQELTAALERR